MQAYCRPVPRLSSIRSPVFVEVFREYEQELVRAGYERHVARLHLRAAAHFGVWIELEGVALETIDDGTVAAFARHRSRCRCPHTSRDRGHYVISCVRVFVRYLRARGVVRTAAAAPPPAPSSVHFSRGCAFIGASSTRRSSPIRSTLTASSASLATTRRRTRPMICGTSWPNGMHTTGATMSPA
mgnify:CR=1 FL=1